MTNKKRGASCITTHLLCFVHEIQFLLRYCYPLCWMFHGIFAVSIFSFLKWYITLLKLMFTVLMYY